MKTSALGILTTVLLAIGSVHAQPIGFRYEIIEFPGDPNISQVAINNAGDIVATSPARATGLLRSHDGSFTDIGFPGSPETLVMSINAAGAIVGSYYAPDRSFAAAFIRNPDGSFESLGESRGSFSSALGISDDGHVVGFGSPPLASLWVRNPDGTLESLNSPNGSTPTDINDSQQVAQGPGIASHATGAFEVISYPGAAGTSANSINNAGDIAGYGSTSNPDGSQNITPFLRTADGTFVGLAIPGAVAAIPQGISDSRVIVGIASFLPDREGDPFINRVFVATPFVIPEPNGYAILLAGLVIAGCAVRRVKCV